MVCWFSVCYCPSAVRPNAVSFLWPDVILFASVVYGRPRLHCFDGCNHVHSWTAFQWTHFKKKNICVISLSRVINGWIISYARVHTGWTCESWTIINVTENLHEIIFVEDFRFTHCSIVLRNHILELRHHIKLLWGIKWQSTIWGLRPLHIPLSSSLTPLSTSLGRVNSFVPVNFLNTWKKTWDTKLPLH